MTLKEYLDANSEVTRADFAKRIGVSEAALSMYISNKRFPKAFTLIQIERETQNQVTASDMAMDHYQ